MIRSDTPVRLTLGGQLEQAARHPINTAIDLRESDRQRPSPTRSEMRRMSHNHHLPLLPEDFPLPVIRADWAEESSCC